MTAKDKAKELVDKMLNSLEFLSNKSANRCALIAVDEIMSAKYTCGCEESIVIDGKYQTYVTYWKQVRDEINNL